VADSIYWTSFADGAIRVGALAGSGNVDTLYDLVQGAAGPRGVAIDSAAGRIYWANQGDNRIRGAPLAGGTVDSLYGPGQVVALPGGVAIDPAAGQIYWTNESDNTIRGARLAGGGTANSLYDGPARGVNGPGGVAIDPAAGRIYWTNSEDNTIRGAPLAGGTASPLYGAADGVNGPAGVAIDSVAGRIYWTNFLDSTIRGAPLAGGGPVDTLYRPADGVSGPIGVAVDPAPAVRITPIINEPRPSTISGWLGTAGGRARNWLLGWLGRSPAGRIYWANNGDNTIRGATLAGGGSVDALYSGSGRGVDWPRFIAVHRAPLGTGAPAITGGGQLGQRLSCSKGAWAADLVGSFLCRAPQSFAYQWALGPSDLSGATLAAYTPTAPGSYTCRVIATNRAGSTAQTSAAVAVS
jgi:DNA-binding beta-propeller fold protein YncE